MDNEVQNNGSDYSHLNVPEFQDLYKAEAERLLKMVNAQMEYYYKKSILRNVDVLSLLQVAQKIEKFESSIPGIENLKSKLHDDMLAVISHIEKEYSEISKENAQKIVLLQEDLYKLKKQSNFLIFLIVLFQWYLFPKYSEVNKQIKVLEQEIKQIEMMEISGKRASLNTEQLIKMSHIFREKYLNIPVPKQDSVQS